MLCSGTIMKTLHKIGTLAFEKNQRRVMIYNRKRNHIVAKKGGKNGRNEKDIQVL